MGESYGEWFGYGGLMVSRPVFPEKMFPFPIFARSFCNENDSGKFIFEIKRVLITHVVLHTFHFDPMKCFILHKGKLYFHSSPYNPVVEEL